MSEVRRGAGRPPTFPADELDARVAAAAAHEFASRGYDAASIDSIAAAAGVSKPALYRAFGSKSQLYCTLLERFAVELASAAMRSFAQSSGPASKRLRLLIDAWFEVLEAHPEEWRVLNSASSADPQIQEVVQRVRAMQIDNDISLVRAFAPKLPEAEVAPIAEAVRGSLVAIGAWWLADADVDRSIPVDAMTRVCEGLVATTVPRPAGRRA